VNIVLAYELSDHGVAALNSLSTPALIDIIVAGVRKKRDSAVRNTK
jgi:hypothetical protein